MKSLGHIPVQSTRNNAGLPVARPQNPTWTGRKMTAAERKAAYAEEDREREEAERHTEWVRRQQEKALGRLNVTDRALRYRANEQPPEGPEICAMCGSRNFVEVDHIDGFEEHGEPENLMWLCRSCNTRKGIAMRNAGLGRRTHQYNPSGGAKNLGQWLQAVGAIRPHVDRGDRGLSSDMKVSDAVAMIRATPQWKRSEFAQQLNKHKRGRRSEVPF